MAKKAKGRRKSAKRAARKTSSKKAAAKKSASKAKKIKAKKVPKKAAKKAVAKKPVAKKAMAKATAAGHPDKRQPIWGDPTHELLYKWDSVTNQYRSKVVEIGKDLPLEKPAKKPIAKKAAAKKATAKASGVGHPDKRVPIWGDPDHELLYKWDADANQYRSKVVPIGGDW